MDSLVERTPLNWKDEDTSLRKGLATTLKEAGRRVVAVS